MLTSNFSKNLLAVAFSIASAVSFSQAASAQSLQAQIQSADAKDGVQTNGFDLSIGEPEATRRYCGAGAFNIYKTWLDNGATQGAAIDAYNEYFDNCMCAQHGGKYCE